MLGFRREKQARSVAHGCASTLVHLAEVSGDAQTRTAWGMDPVDLDPNAVRVRSVVETGEKLTEFVPQPRKDGQCWFRTGDHVCPFSKNWRLQNDKNPKVRPDELRELHKIYVECGRAATHRGSAR